MGARLLAVKFHIPPWRAGLVARPRLLEQLQRGLDECHKLILISAPAGYGKTTLAAEWLKALAARLPGEGGGVRAAWLSLDEADNDPARFLRYFLAAFQQADQSLGGQTAAMLEMPGQPDLSSLLDDLLNDLAGRGAPLVVVLDDYHVIANPKIHAALEYFLERLPGPVHLVLTTRADPPLPLARWRARSQMTELRARHLRFTVDEARAYFGLANLPLAEAALRALDERTEGWAAGLQLAALALERQPDPAAFIETFRGSHRYVLDYLAEEVLQQQDEGTRLFLKQTSLLDRFNAELCTALTGRLDSQEVLVRLEQSNLFIIPLDDERGWRRYHRLFADYLSSLLSKSERAALRRKAALWHEANGLVGEAVRYALASHDHDFAADLVERALDRNSTWSEGDLAGLAGWVEALPPGAFHSRPRLGVHASRVLYLQGRFDEAEGLLAQAERFLQSQAAAPESEALLALIAVYRGAVAAVGGDSQRVLSLVLAAQARIPPEDHLAHARAFFSLGLAYEVMGLTAQAEENYLRSSAEAHRAGVLFLAIHGLCSAAKLQISQGRLSLAEQTCRRAIQLAQGARLPPLGLAWTILGAVALERNDLPAAERFLRDGIALSRRGGLMDDVIDGLASLGRLLAYQGSREAVQAVAAEMRSILRAFGIPRMEQLGSAHLARLHLYLGQRQAAALWAGEYQSRRAEPLQEYEELTLARILISEGDLEPVPGILQPILEISVGAGRMRTALEAALLLGLVHGARGEAAAALKQIGKALEWAAPEGMIRLFLDEGPPMMELLPRLRSVAPGLVDSILSAGTAPGGPPPPLLDRLPDRLSEQEMRVLDLVVAGKSNAEIAAELFISVGTAKWHVHNILRKLGVKNRPQAIALVRRA